MHRKRAEEVESAAQKAPDPEPPDQGPLKQLNSDRVLTAVGGLTTVSYAKTAC
jgi:hypothetical protein